MMKLAPPTSAKRQLNRPPIYSSLSVVDSADSGNEWPVSVTIRTQDYDVITRPSDSPSDIQEGYLVWREMGKMRRFAVRLEGLEGPVLSWRVFYTGDIEVVNLRQEWRNNRYTINGRIWRPEDPNHKMITMSYDFSPSAIRFFSPWLLNSGDKVVVAWDLDGAIAEMEMIAVRVDGYQIWWEGQSGYKLIAGFSKNYSDAIKYAWRNFCWKHQPDSDSNT